MPTTFAVLIAVLVLGLLAVRLAAPVLPLRHGSARLPVGNTVAAVVGLLGLLFHCGAMFYTGTVGAVPGTGSTVDLINRLGTGSIVLFAIPALLVIAGAWPVPRAVWALIVASLAAVGVTMYDGGPTRVHLIAITVCVAVLAVTAATVVRGPARRSPSPA